MTRFDPTLHRVPHINPPTVVRHYVRREDLAANQLNRDLVTPSKLERVCWVAIAPLAVVSFYLIASV